MPRHHPCLMLCLLSFCVLAQNDNPELGVPGPISAPVQHQRYWRFERELYGYDPAFTPGVVSFDPDNRPYMRNEQDLMTLAENGQWLHLDWRRAISDKWTKWDGECATGAFAEEHIVWDSDGDAYTLINATRSSVGRIFLFHSRDRCRTWDIYSVSVGYARLEHNDGHNTFDRPPIVLFTDSFTPLLRLLAPVKKADGTLDLGTPVIVSEDACLVPNHSGGGNASTTIGGKTHIVFSGNSPVPGHEHDGTAQYAVTYDHEQRTVSDPVFLGLGGNNYDPSHNMPAIVADSTGTLHVLLGSHHDPFRYTRSLAPNSIDGGWTEPVEIGEPKSMDGSYTYIGLVCDGQDNLHLVARWAGAGYYFRLVYLRKPAGADWEKHKYLMVPFRSNYTVWYHKLTLDRQDRLWVNYQPFSSNMGLAAAASMIYKWPERNNAWAHGYAMLHEPGMLMSPDGGETWRLATTQDFIDPAPAHEQPEPAADELTTTELTPIGQLGGQVTAVELRDRLAFTIIGQRLVVLDLTNPQRPRTVGQVGPIPGRISGLTLAGDTAYVPCGPTGLQIIDIADPAQPQLADLVKTGGYASHLLVVGDRGYLSADNGGLIIYDLSDPRQPQRLGGYRGAQTWRTTVNGDVAYVAARQQGLRIVDVSDPAAPRELASLPAENRGEHAVFGMTYDGNGLLYATGASHHTVMRVIDVTDPTAPKIVNTATRELGLGGWGRQIVIDGDRAWYPQNQAVLELELDPVTVARTYDSPAHIIHDLSRSGDLLAGTANLDGLRLFSIAQGGEVGAYSEGQCPWGVAVDGDLACLADFTAGLFTVDLSVPGAPRILGWLPFEPAPKSYNRIIRPARFRVALANSRAYLAAGHEGIAVVDLAAPAAPTETGKIAMPTAIRDLAIAGDHLYAVGARQKLYVYNLATGQLSTTVDLPREALSVAATGDLLVVGDAQRVDGAVRLYDLAPGKAPTPRGMVILDNDTWGLGGDGTTVYAAQANRGVVVIDASDRDAPQTVRRLTAHGDVWQVVPAAGRLHLAKGQQGFSIATEEPE